MMRNFIRKLVLPLTGVLMMGLVGCTGGGDDDDTTPPPAPTPTPPQAFDDWFRVTEMLIGTSNQGVDVDDDGTVDNSIQEALDTINASIFTAIVVQLCWDGEVPEGEDPSDDSNCTQQEKAFLNQVVKALLDAVLSVESLSTAINEPIQSFDRNYLIHFKETARLGNAELEWNTGEFDGTGFTVGQELGSQAGKLDASGNGVFGPGNLTLTLEFQVPGDTGGDLSFSLVMYNGHTEISDYDDKEIEDQLTGGALSLADLLSLVGTILEQLAEVIPDDGDGDPSNDFDPDATLAEVAAAVAPFADIDLDGDGAGGEEDLNDDGEIDGDADDGISVGLVFQAGTITPVD